MAATREFESPLTVTSHRGAYGVRFGDEARSRISSLGGPRTHVLLDARVGALHRETLTGLLDSSEVLVLEADEGAKSLEKMPEYVEHLLRKRIRRGHQLVCVGGGILQDITCFLAATLLRGLDWHFVPTTLLAQADSCIGSKSSINVGSAKNVVGTYTPPAQILLWPGFLKTLDARELKSGIGEMLKVHAIDGPESFAEIARDYDALFELGDVLLTYVRRSLEIKKVLVEADEFDRGPRIVLNYGHSFGHAIESATAFGIPHGIAVTMGMDLANFVAFRLGVAPSDIYARMHSTFRRNYSGFESYAIGSEAVISALAKDKKNTDAGLKLVLPGTDGRIGIVEKPNDDRLASACAEYFARERLQ